MQISSTVVHQLAVCLLLYLRSRSGVFNLGCVYPREYAGFFFKGYGKPIKIWETGFSCLLITKSKPRSRLNVEASLQCSLAITVPLWIRVEKKQFQPSHSFPCQQINDHNVFLCRLRSLRHIGITLSGVCLSVRPSVCSHVL